MIVRETAIPGAFVLEPEPHLDERGSFARVWSREELEEHGLPVRIEQSSVSFNRRRGTLRGLHLQIAPSMETKYVRCTRGSVLDVVVDLRPGSPTYLEHVAVELTADNAFTMVVPEGAAHGFQTLRDESEVYYQISAAYDPERARGVRWNDPVLGIAWPLPDPIMNARDASYPDYDPATPF